MKFILWSFLAFCILIFYFIFFLFEILWTCQDFTNSSLRTFYVCDLFVLLIWRYGECTTWVSMLIDLCLLVTHQRATNLGICRTSQTDSHWTDDISIQKIIDPTRNDLGLQAIYSYSNNILIPRNVTSRNALKKFITSQQNNGSFKWCYFPYINKRTLNKLKYLHVIIKL